MTVVAAVEYRIAKCRLRHWRRSPPKKQLLEAEAHSRINQWFVVAVAVVWLLTQTETLQLVAFGLIARTSHPWMVVVEVAGQKVR